MAVIRTFKNLQDEVLAILDEVGDTATTLTLVKNAIAAAHEKRVTEERWPFMLWEQPVLINVVAGTQVYSLHSEFFRPFYFWNRTENDFVEQIDEASLIASGIDWINDSGAAMTLALWGRSEVAAQPAAASALTVSSSVAGDNGTASITVRGDTADGVTSETIFAGSTGATLFTKVLKVTKNGTWTGTMTLAAGATTLLTLFASESGRSYQQVFFLVKPDTDVVVEYKFYRQPSPLVNDGDRPDLPPPFEELLVYDALLALAAYNQYDPATVAVWEKKRDDLLLDLRQSTTEQAEAVGRATNYTTYIPR